MGEAGDAEDSWFKVIGWPPSATQSVNDQPTGLSAVNLSLH
jgi:hypothetical protein